MSRPDKIDPLQPSPVPVACENEDFTKGEPPRLDPSEMRVARQMLEIPSTKRRFIKLQSDEQVTLRLLPFGQPNTFWRRIATHWSPTGRPLYCPRDTATALGGNPTAPCPACEASKAYTAVGAFDMAHKLE